MGPSALERDLIGLVHVPQVLSAQAHDGVGAFLVPENIHVDYCGEMDVVGGDDDALLPGPHGGACGPEGQVAQPLSPTALGGLDAGGPLRGRDAQSKRAVGALATGPGVVLGR